VRLGDDGAVRVRNSNGRVAVLVDLSGWYDRSAPGGVLFHATTPRRLLDTREAADPARRRLGPGERRVLRLTTGTAALPASATAVLLNVTGVGATRATDVRVYPRTASGDVPLVSNLNLGAGQTNADAVLVGLGEGGDVVLRNADGLLALVGDLSGWFGPET